jgi:hypothetical protein
MRRTTQLVTMGTLVFFLGCSSDDEPDKNAATGGSSGVGASGGTGGNGMGGESGTAGNSGSGGIAGGIAQPPGFPYVLSDDVKGVTHEYFNRGAYVRWQNPGADWWDANDEEQGAEAFAQLEIANQGAGQDVEIDLSAALATHDACRFVSEGILLKKLSGGHVKFHSRQAVDPALRPKLVLVDDGGAEKVFDSVADATLSSSTDKALGTAATISVGDSGAVLAFGACDAAASTTKSMKLRLTTSDHSGGAIEVATFLLRIPTAIKIDAPPGFSYDYADNVALRSDERVWMATDFDTLPACAVDDCASPHEVCSGFTTCGETFQFATVESEPAENGFSPRSGKRAMRVHGNQTTAVPGAYYNFVNPAVNGAEQESARFRYFVSFVDEPAAEAWTPQADSGKFPGWSGPRSTYKSSIKCGNGGIPANGTCWSARGHYGETIPADNAFAHYTVLNTYVYHPDFQTKGTGQLWPWNETNQGQLERGKWHCVEQHLQMNTPGEYDGRLQIWVDEQLVVNRQEIKLREAPPYDPEIKTVTAGINSVWFSFQFGGPVNTPDKPITLYIDDLVVAKGDLDGGTQIGCK